MEENNIQLTAEQEKKFQLITRNLQEVIGENELKSLISQDKEISLYWGTMPTSSISIAYFFPMMKVADFLRAGVKVKILLADIHAALDSVPWDVLEKRYKYYEIAVHTILDTIGVDRSKLEFVKGSTFQLGGDYSLDLLKLSTLATVNSAKHAAAEVVKLGDSPKLSGVIYPLMQALDEQYLSVDAQFGGMDQRKIMVFAREYLPKINYKARIELINPLIRGLVGVKMSSSVENSKVDLMDGEKVVSKKLNKADCIAGDADNGIMALAQYLIFVLKGDKGEDFVIQRPEKYGGDLTFKSYDELENAFVKEELHPLDLKMGVAAELNKLLAKFRESEDVKRIHEAAYGAK